MHALPSVVSGMDAADIFYDVAMRRLDEQIERNDAYGAKVTAALSVGTTVLPITFGLLEFQDRGVPTLGLALLTQAVAVYGLLMVCALNALVPTTLDYRPDLGELAKHSIDLSDTDTKRWVAKACVTSIKDNEGKLTRQFGLVKAALILLALETALLSVAVLVVIG